MGTRLHKVPRALAETISAHARPTNQQRRERETGQGGPAIARPDARKQKKKHLRKSAPKAKSLPPRASRLSGGKKRTYYELERVKAHIQGNVNMDERSRPPTTP